MSLYDELTRYQILPTAYEDWAGYRQAVTDYILANTSPDTTLAIFGAGRCNDIDLYRLSTHFSSITLLDANHPAMKEAAMRYGLSSDPKLFCKEADFSGISPEDYRALGDELTALYNVSGNETRIEVLEDFMCFKLDRLYRKADAYTMDFGINTFDYSMAFGVHSQINNMASWIFSAFEANIKAHSTLVTQRICAANDRMVPKFNTAILAATKKTAFFGCERINTASNEPVEGAYQCIMDLKNRDIVTSQSLTLWPFYPAGNCYYQMLIQCCDPSGIPG